MGVDVPPGVGDFRLVSHINKHSLLVGNGKGHAEALSRHLYRSDFRAGLNGFARRIAERYHCSGNGSSDLGNGFFFFGFGNFLKKGSKLLYVGREVCKLFLCLRQTLLGCRDLLCIVCKLVVDGLLSCRNSSFHLLNLRLGSVCVCLIGIYTVFSHTKIVFGRDQIMGLCFKGVCFCFKCSCRIFSCLRTILGCKLCIDDILRISIGYCVVIFIRCIRKIGIRNTFCGCGGCLGIVRLAFCGSCTGLVFISRKGLVTLCYRCSI